MENGPFTVGDRVRVPSRDSDGTVTAVGESQAIRVYSAGSPDEDRVVTTYAIELDNGLEVRVVDRDGHIVSL